MRNYLVVVFSFFFLTTMGQELPPIFSFAKEEYKAGNQNWMISQDKNHFIFFANNEGLLEYNGANWNLYKSPNETIIRSVKVIGNRIYTGCYMEFGYWTRKNNGKLRYTSLSSKIKNKLLDDEQFWNIISYSQWVIFQSLNRIYIFDSKTNSCRIVSPETNILKSFQTSNSIFYQTIDYALYEIEDGKSKLIRSGAQLQKNKIINVFSQDDGLLIHTQFNGFYKLVNGNLVKFTTEADTEIVSGSIYSSQVLSDDSFAVGTVSKGVYVLSKEGKVTYHIDQSKGLCNNTVLSIFEDFDHNLWTGLDNGINCINLNSPIKSYIDDSGTFGTVYCALLHHNKLYIGTNQGLFCKEYKTNASFQFVSGTKGQVWSLFVYDNTLFCGHDSGTFIIEDENATPIFSQSGTWKFQALPSNPNIILQGNYQGISVLEKRNNRWVFKHKIKGFNYSTKYFEITPSNEVYVSHEYKGVFRFDLTKNLTQCLNLFTYSNPPKGKNASLATFNKHIYYVYKDGVFKLNQKTKQFEKDASLSTVFNHNEYSSGRLIKDNANKLWLFTKSYINYYTVNKLNSSLKRNSIPIPATLSTSMLGYENITQLSNSDYLIGTTDGFYVFNINELNLKNHKVSITDIAINERNKSQKSHSITQSGDFNHNENNITFTYTVPEYNKYIFTEYQYSLRGFQDEWSEWSSKTTVNFKNLPPGDYVFKVRARTSNSFSDNVAVYKFSIEKPFYATNLAIAIYVLLFCILLHYVNKQYKNYYSRQREKLIEENNRLLEIKELENEQQLMKIRNEQLTQDVDAKRKELAVSTMSLIKKDELLALIKEDLKKTSEEDNSRSIKSVISIINRNISEEDTWKGFKDAFDIVDKDFLKKVKQAHPSLTPNDLRLCAYLRLNLSSKEIAPLLNISVRSIEIKRYRLRKKMNLPHEKGLVEYILSI